MEFALYKFIIISLFTWASYASFLNYYTNLIEDNKNDCGKLWKAIKSVTSTNVTASQVESLIIDGEDVLEPEMVSAKFGSFFKTAIGKLRQALPTT